MCSCTTNTAHNICIDGVMYWIIPIADNGTSFAALPNNNNGTAVTIPVLTINAAWPGPWEGNVDGVSTTYPNATGKSTKVSAVSDAIGLSNTRFFINP